MTGRDQQIDEMGDAQYALECILARLPEEEFRRVFEELPPRAREHVRLTAADYLGPLRDWTNESG